MNWISTALAVGRGALGGIWGYVAAAVFAGAVAASGAAYTTHRFDLVTLQRVELKDAQNATAAVEAQAVAMQGIIDNTKAEDKIALDAAVSHAQGIIHIVERTHDVIQTIPEFVTPAAVSHACIPLGMLRVLDAAILGGTGGAEDPRTLPEPAGQSDAACAPIAADVLEQRLVALVSTAEQDIKQLTDLQAYLDKAIPEYNNETPPAGTEPVTR